MSTIRILLVEDDRSVRFSLEEMLHRDGYIVDAVESGKRAIVAIGNVDYDLALLDLMLQDTSGLEVLVALKEQSPTTVAIILTAHASIDSAVEALRYGAHDYLLKPCNTPTLRQSIRSGLAKRQELIRQEDTSQTLESIQKLLQTNQGLGETSQGNNQNSSSSPDLESRFLQHNDIKIDRHRYIVTYGDSPLSFSPTEFQILMLLILKVPQVVTPTEMAAEVLDYVLDEDEARKLISYHIYRMRRKFKELVADQEIIQTIRGVGYTLS